MGKVPLQYFPAAVWITAGKSGSTSPSKEASVFMFGRLYMRASLHASAYTCERLYMLPLLRSVFTWKRLYMRMPLHVLTYYRRRHSAFSY